MKQPDLATIKSEALSAIAAVKTETELRAIQVKYLGRKGSVTEILRQIGGLPEAKRARAGATANALRNQVGQAIAAAGQRLRQESLKPGGSQARLDLTVPTKLTFGHLHPISRMIQEILAVFQQMGYEIIDGPEVETEWYNFESLLVYADHPARDMQDTFYLEKGNLPRTHTSGVQVRYMEAHQPPIRILSPGKVFRNEDEDPRHTWMFHQIEGLVVDEGIRLSDLKGTLLTMMRGILTPDTEIRLRPNYFPYTEPSVELDATCIICHGKGCKTCSGTGWIELGGAGMVHPQVFHNVGIYPTIYSGFAFGFGPERIASIKYQVPDLREFWRPNLRFLEQF